MSLRLRLTLFYSVLLGLTLIAFSAVLFVLLETSLMREVDHTLERSVGQVESSLAANISGVEVRGGVATILFDPSPIREFTTPGVYVQILDRQGRIIAHSPNLSNEVMPIDPDTVHAALAGGTYVNDTQPGQSAESLRILTKPWQLEGRTLGVLQVGVSLYNLRVTMRSLTTLGLVGILSTMILAGAGIWLLTRRALAPIETIAGTAEHIGEAQDLSQRLTIRGPADEVGRLARAFNTMMGRLERAFDSQKQFVADSSHELRTPLTVIRGNLDLLKRDSSPEMQQEYMSNIEHEVGRMSKMVDNLMLLAQLDSPIDAVPAVVALEEVVLQVYNHARVISGDKNVLLGHVDAARVVGDHDRLVQLLLNLVENAIKYTPAGGVITLESRAPGAGQGPPFACMSVHDTGIGIAADQLPHVFNRFYRADKARSRALGGTGLGLAIVKGIAASYGGRVEVQSAVGQGSTFSVYLPAVP